MLQQHVFPFSDPLAEDIDNKPSRTPQPERRLFLKQLAAIGVPTSLLAAGIAQATPPARTLQARAVGGQGTAATFNGLQFKAIRQHENDHVAFLLNVLGANARPKPTFVGLRQPDVQSFALVSHGLENTGAGAYLGAAPYIASKTYLAGAGSIALIEARHAGWLDTLLGQILTTNVFGVAQSFETPLTAAQVVTLAGAFIASLNGGPPVTYDTTPSAANDIAILNFALALEYLEAEFYNINVPMFYG